MSRRSNGSRWRNGRSATPSAWDCSTGSVVTMSRRTRSDTSCAGCSGKGSQPVAHSIAISHDVAAESRRCLSRSWICARNRPSRSGLRWPKGRHACRGALSLVEEIEPIVRHRIVEVVRYDERFPRRTRVAVHGSSAWPARAGRGPRRGGCSRSPHRSRPAPIRCEKWVLASCTPTTADLVI